MYLSNHECCSFKAYCIALQPCQHQEDGSKLLCRMPAVMLPDDLSKQLNSSESGTINNTHGPGVAVYWSSDRRTRADIYIGLKLDGVIRYQNLSSFDRAIKLRFALTPVVPCTYDHVDFDPRKNTVIAIKVNWIIVLRIQFASVTSLRLVSHGALTDGVTFFLPKTTDDLSGVAMICCEKGQSWKLCHEALTADFRTGCSSCSMT